MNGGIHRPYACDEKFYWYAVAPTLNNDSPSPTFGEGCFSVASNALRLLRSRVSPVQPASRVRLGGATISCNSFHNNRLRSSNPVAAFAAIRLMPMSGGRALGYSPGNASVYRTGARLRFGSSSATGANPVLTVCPKPPCGRSSAGSTWRRRAGPTARTWSTGRGVGSDRNRRKLICPQTSRCNAIGIARLPPKGSWIEPRILGFTWRDPVTGLARR